MMVNFCIFVHMYDVSLMACSNTLELSPKASLLSLEGRYLPRNYPSRCSKIWKGVWGADDWTGMIIVHN